jgi:hypothetical protein
MQMTIRFGTWSARLVLMLSVACSTESPNPGSAGGGAGTGGSSGTGGSTAGGSNADGASTGGERGGYKSAPWISETAAPREQSITGSQHGSTVRVWENAPLVASLKGGRDGWEGRPFPDQWSMAVKELYDQTSGELVGVAASFKTMEGGAFGAWTYYCYGPENRCSFQGSAPKDMPIYGKGSTSPASNCGFCHGFTVFTIPP